MAAVAALFLTPALVAERWQCSPEHVQRLCKSGELPAMKLGAKGWRITPTAVEAYETLHSAPSTPASAPVQAERSRPSPAVDLGGEYEPVFSGPVPWRTAVIDAASPAAGRGRATGKKKAASQRH